MIKLAEAKVPPTYQPDLERAAQILKEAGCSEIFLFGSLAEDTLREGSDIDLAVRGVLPSEFIHTWGKLSSELTHAADLIDLDENEPFANYLLTVGKFKTVNEKVASQINFEIEEIDRLLADYAPFLEPMFHKEPNLADKTVAGSVLHSFYNGLENIFNVVAKRYDRQVPTGDQSHKDLLRQMTQATAQRTPVISTTLAQTLENYMEFRHFFRHAYLLKLKWEKMAILVSSLHSVWQQTKAELQTFLSTLDSAQIS